MLFELHIHSPRVTESFSMLCTLSQYNVIRGTHTFPKGHRIFQYAVYSESVLCFSRYTRCTLTQYNVIRGTHSISATRVIVSICVVYTVGQHAVYSRYTWYTCHEGHCIGLYVVYCRSEQCILLVHIHVVYLPQGSLYLCVVYSESVWYIPHVHIIYPPLEPMYLSVCGVLWVSMMYSPGTHRMPQVYVLTSHAIIFLAKVSVV